MPRSPLPRAIVRRQVPGGEASGAAKLQFLTQLIRAHGRRPDVRAAALAIVSRAGVRSRDWPGYVRAIQAAVQRLLYAREPVEQFAGPDQVVRQGGGDCDDQVLLVGSLLYSIRIPVRVHVIGWPKPGQRSVTWRHVYVEARLGRRWVPVETIHRVPLGWDPRSRVAAALRRRSR